MAHIFNHIASFKPKELPSHLVQGRKNHFLSVSKNFHPTKKLCEWFLQLGYHRTSIPCQRTQEWLCEISWVGDFAAFFRGETCYQFHIISSNKK